VPLVKDEAQKVIDKEENIKNAYNKYHELKSVLFRWSSPLFSITIWRGSKKLPTNGEIDISEFGKVRRGSWRHRSRRRNYSNTNSSQYELNSYDYDAFNFSEKVFINDLSCNLLGEKLGEIAKEVKCDNLNIIYLNPKVDLQSFLVSQEEMIQDYDIELLSDWYEPQEDKQKRAPVEKTIVFQLSGSSNSYWSQVKAADIQNDCKQIIIKLKADRYNKSERNAQNIIESIGRVDYLYFITNTINAVEKNKSNQYSTKDNKNWIYNLDNK
jgi:hypothetical protein